MIVLLDTNFLLLPHRHKIDIISEIERIVPEAHDILVPHGVILELEKISDSNKTEAVAARVGIDLITKNKIKVIESTGYVDDFLINFAKENDQVIVATNDKNLKKQLKGKATILCMRNKCHLMRI